MKIALKNHATRRTHSTRGFSLVEPVIGVGILVVLIVAFYSGLSQGAFTMRMARENQRATQILLQKTETVRLCKWNQITNGFIPASFIETYIPLGSSRGISYTGTISIANAPMSAPYSSNSLKLVTIDLRWATGGVSRHRQMKTLISRWGINNYVD